MNPTMMESKFPFPRRENMMKSFEFWLDGAIEDLSLAMSALLRQSPLVKSKPRCVGDKSVCGTNKAKYGLTHKYKHFYLLHTKYSCESILAEK